MAERAAEKAARTGSVAASGSFSFESTTSVWSNNRSSAAPSTAAPGSGLTLNAAASRKRVTTASFNTDRLIDAPPGFNAEDSTSVSCERNFARDPDQVSSWTFPLSNSSARSGCGTPEGHGAAPKSVGCRDPDALDVLEGDCSKDASGKSKSDFDSSVVAGAIRLTGRTLGTTGAADLGTLGGAAGNAGFGEPPLPAAEGAALGAGAKGVAATAFRT